MLLATLGVLLQLGAPETFDTTKVLREARAAQARFERVRRMHLPRKLTAGGSRNCHARVGRYCYWYDPSDTTVAPEPARIRDARHELLTSLDSAAILLPAQDWIVGQRVRYLIEAGRPEDAIAVARACAAEQWWCDALAGLALHVAGRYRGADSAFSLALDAMPAEQRCDWMDLSDLADTRLRRRLRGADCRAREAAAHQLWSLSQPLWMLEGNDLRTEHFARHTMATALQRAANAHAMSFGEDSRELLLRYGWAEWFTREETGIATYASYAVTGHDREPSFHFFPRAGDAEALRFPRASAWQLGDTLAPSRYAPRRIEWLADLAHHVARFPRGDSMLVAVAFAPPDTTGWTRARAAMAVHDGRDAAVVARDSGTVLSAMLTRDSAVIGVEVYEDSSRRAARARYALAPLACSGWCVSDIMLIRPSPEGPGTLDEALGTALGRLSVRAGETVGAWFEVQRPRTGAARERADFTLTVTPIRVSALRRLAAALRVADPPNAVRLRWSGLLEYAGAVAPQYVSLRLPGGARGRYRVEVRVVPAGGETLVTWRDVVVTR